MQNPKTLIVASLYFLAGAMIVSGAFGGIYAIIRWIASW